MIKLNKDNCAAEVVEETMPVAVDFWSPTCPECMALMPRCEALEKEFGRDVKFTSVDCSKKRSVALKFRVMSLPTFAFWTNGAEIKRLTLGQCTEENIRAELEKLSALGKK